MSASITLTPEALAAIVSGAVTEALAASGVAAPVVPSPVKPAKGGRKGKATVNPSLTGAVGSSFGYKDKRGTVRVHAVIANEGGRVQTDRGGNFALTTLAKLATKGIVTAV